MELVIPETDEVVAAQLLPSDTPFVVEDELRGAEVLADWVTSDENPYFARNAVNLLWANFFGTGLVEPLDDLSESNPASHPELLDELANSFSSNGFDIQHLTQALVLSTAYQRSSKHPAASNASLFARMAVRGLTGEQLYESRRIAAGLPRLRADLDSTEEYEQRKHFVDRFFAERPLLAERSIIQALTLFNGETTGNLTDPLNSPTLLAASHAPFLDTKGRIEILFLSTLARKPTEDEYIILVPIVESRATGKTVESTLADIFWALLNSSEFNTNH